MKAFEVILRGQMGLKRCGVVFVRHWRERLGVRGWWAQVAGVYGPVEFLQNLEGW